MNDKLTGYKFPFLDQVDELQIEMLKEQLTAANVRADAAVTERDQVRKICSDLAAKHLSKEDGYTLIDFLRLWYDQQTERADAMEMESEKWKALAGQITTDWIPANRAIAARADNLRRLLNNWVAWYEMHGFEHGIGCLLEESLEALEQTP